MSDPHAHYERLHRDATSQHAKLARWMATLAWIRLAVLLVAIGASYRACEHKGASWRGAAVAFAVAAALSVAIARLAQRLAALEATRVYAQAGTARVEDRWKEVGVSGGAFSPPDHVYAADLDLFGDHSLFALLCMARTANGQRALAGWLLAPAAPGEARARQVGVAELRDRPELRQRLWRVGGLVAAELPATTEALVTWLRGEARAPSAGLRAVQAVLGVAGMAAVVGVFLGVFWPLLAIAPLLIAASSRTRSVVEDLSKQLFRRTDELAALAALASIVERERWSSPWLSALQQRLSSEGAPASKRIRQLVRLVRWFESRRNPFFGVLFAPALVGAQLAGAIERWRARHGGAAARWIDALGELEASTSLATFAFDHPELPFPELVDDAAGPCFEATALAHPLLPRSKRVANDVALGAPTKLLLVTGSNMSGKSTLLRAIGANAVLAQAGAPVVATHLRLSRLSIGATLRTSDSLEQGVSRFYAEVRRLRSIVALAAASPLTLFLLDEILHGTNSQDRATGAEAIVRALVSGGAIGLVTTHDLSLARIADALAPAARNVHFEDVIEGDEIRFDHQLKPGVVPRGNALQLMRLVGLPV